MFGGERGCWGEPGLPPLSAHLSCALQGASANWWNHRHFQHHAKPNIFHKDPDVNMLHVFVLGKWQPVEVGLGANVVGRVGARSGCRTATCGVADMGMFSVDVETAQGALN